MPNPSQWDRERDAELIELHSKGLLGKDIAEIMNVHPMAVSRRLRTLKDEGVLTPSPRPAPAPASRAVPDHIRRLKRAQRGFDVPPHLEGQYIALLKSGMTIADACRCLKISRDR